MVVHAKISTPDLLYGLETQNSILNQMPIKDKPYFSFPESMYKILERPGKRKIVVKEVSSELEISSSKIRKYVEAIYDDIVDYLFDNDNAPIRIGNPKVNLWVKDRFNQCVHIENLEFETIPRVEEAVELSFLFPLYWHGHFEVTQLYHTLNYDEHIVNLQLRPKRNLFFKIKADEIEYKRDKEYYDRQLD
jgi:hypothetical protein